MKIGVTNLKGGVGKTTLSINLAVAFAHMDYKVIIIDTDTNQNSVEWYERRSEDLKKVEVWSYTKTDKLVEMVKSAHAAADIVIMDGTPNLGVMTTKIMGASDLLIIPTRPMPNDYHSLQEFFPKYEEVKAVRENLQAYFLLNEYGDRVLQKNIRQGLSEHYPDIPLLETTIATRIVYGETILAGTGVLEGKDDSAKAEIISLANEIVAIGEKMGLFESAA
jgi:chromosome partitioning protein